MFGKVRHAAVGNVPSRHSCDLQQSSVTGLPRPPPYANRLRKLVRLLQSWNLASRAHPDGRSWFRSTAALLAERKRHARQKLYVIHPCSKFFMCDEIASLVLWNFVFFKDPLVAVYYTDPVRNVFKSFWTTLALVVDLLYVCNICIWFVTGYNKQATKTIILEPRQIARNYLKTYFVFDVIGTIPFNYVVNLFIGGDHFEPTAFYANFLRVFRLVRIKSMLETLRHITLMLHLRGFTYDTIRLVVLMGYCVHWSACMLYLLPKSSYVYYRSAELLTDSWAIFIYKTEAAIKAAAPSSKYSAALRIVMGHFYGINSFSRILAPNEQVLCILILMIGQLSVAAAITCVHMIVGSESKSLMKFEEFKHELHTYARKKRLSAALKDRLIAFYDNNFQRKYFKERAILHSLTDHLRLQLLMHSTGHLFNKTTVLRDVSEPVLVDLLLSSSMQTFLENEVIAEGDAPSRNVYFISRGCVAMFDATGGELKHLEIGEVFGDLEICDRVVPFSYTAAEICDVLILPKDDFLRYMQTNETFEGNVMRNLTVKRKDLTMTAAHDKHFTAKTALEDLKYGKILESRRLRAAFTYNEI